MLRKSLLTLAVFAGVASARAEIGWTYEQLAAKYVLDKDSRELLIDGGKGGWASYLVWTFGTITSSGGLTLPEWFIYTLSNRDKGSHSKLTPYRTCSAIAYERPNADLTKDDVQKLLGENACGQKWKAPTYDGEGKLWQWETEHKKGESYLAATWYTTSKDAVGLFPKCGYGSMTLEIVVNMGENDLSKSPGEVP
jgi:hypothetical protein